MDNKSKLQKKEYNNLVHALKEVLKLRLKEYEKEKAELNRPGNWEFRQWLRKNQSFEEVDSFLKCVDVLDRYRYNEYEETELYERVKLISLSLKNEGFNVKKSILGSWGFAIKKGAYMIDIYILYDKGWSKKRWNTNEILKGPYMDSYEGYKDRIEHKWNTSYEEFDKFVKFLMFDDTVEREIKGNELYYLIHRSPKIYCSISLKFKGEKLPFSKDEFKKAGFLNSWSMDIYKNSISDHRYITTHTLDDFEREFRNYINEVISFLDNKNGPAHY